MSVVVEGRNREEIGTALQFTAVQGLAGPQGRESVVQPLTCQPLRGSDSQVVELISQL